VIAVDRLSKRSLYLVPNGNSECKILRVKGSGRPRDIDDPQQIPVLWIPNRGRRTGPNANFMAEMLASMDLHRSRRGDGGSDGICPNVRLFPTSTLFKVEQVAKIDRPWISRCLEDKCRWVCNNDHRIRVSEKKACLPQGRPGRLQKSRMCRVALNELWFMR
jgi:hypothetical protein